MKKYLEMLFGIAKKEIFKYFTMERHRYVWISFWS